MEQPRFFEVRGEQSGEWLVLDAKHYPPRVICRCMGWNAPKNAALIVAALEAHNSELYAKLALGSVQRLVANACLASDKADLTPLPDPATGKPLNRVQNDLLLRFARGKEVEKVIYSNLRGDG